eukprot:jgi/Ulvmu1/8147/UM040_0044.1
MQTILNKEGQLVPMENNKQDILVEARAHAQRCAREYESELFENMRTKWPGIKVSAATVQLVEFCPKPSLSFWLPFRSTTPNAMCGARDIVSPTEHKQIHALNEEVKAKILSIVSSKAQTGRTEALQVLSVISSAVRVAAVASRPAGLNEDSLFLGLLCQALANAGQSVLEMWGKARWACDPGHGLAKALLLGRPGDAKPSLPGQLQPAVLQAALCVLSPFRDILGALWVTAAGALLGQHAPLELVVRGDPAQISLQTMPLLALPNHILSAIRRKLAEQLLQLAISQTRMGLALKVCNI